MSTPINATTAAAAATEQRKQEQCFLLDNLDFFVELAKENVGFTTILPVFGSPTTFLNRVERGEPVYDNVFYTLTPAQLSTLVPKLKFYVRRGDVEQEVKFTDVTNVADITERKRPRAVGVKEFMYKFPGTNVEEYKYNIEAEVQIYCNSLTDLVEEQVQPPLTSGIRVLDLILPVGKRRVKRAGEAVSSLNPLYVEIRVECGWMPPSHVPGLNKDRLASLQRSLEAQQLNIHLYTKLYDIVYNENGTIAVSVKYQGRLEKNARIANIVSQRSAREEYIQTETLKRMKKRGIVDSIAGGQVRAEVEKELQSQTDPQARIKSYVSILERLDKMGRIYYVSAEPADLGVRRASGPGPVADPTVGIESNLTIQEKLEESKERRKNLASKNKERLKAQMANGKKIASVAAGAIEDAVRAEETAKKISIDKSKAQPAALEAVKERFATFLKSSFEENDNKAPIYFLYLGDIIEAAGLTALMPGNALGSLSAPYAKEGIKNTILGPIEIPRIGGGDAINLSLSTFPISLNLFMAFFVDRVIKNLRSDYSYFDFIKDLIRIVHTSIESCYDEYYKQNFANDTHSIIGFRELSLPENLMRSLGDGTVAISANANDLPFMNKARANGGMATRNVLVISMVRGMQRILPEQFTTAGEAEKRTMEKNLDIITLRPGLDHGILKRVEFSSAEQDGLLEANLERILAEGKIDVRFLQKTHRVNITLFGTPDFYNGQLIKVFPALIASDDEAIAAELFLSGYYTVISHEGIIKKGEYETLLEAVFEAPLHAEFNEGRVYRGQLSVNTHPDGTKISRKEIEKSKSDLQKKLLEDK